MKKKHFSIIVFFLFLGCTSQQIQQTNLCIMELGRQDGIEYVYLPNDYGFMIIWPDNQEPELYIYDKPAHMIKMTNEFPVFIEDLRQFPDAVKVDRIRSCGITSAGMSVEYKDILNDVIENKKFTLTDIEDGNFGVCTCESSYVHRYKTINDIKKKIAINK